MMYRDVLSVLTLVGAVQAHMSMFYPPPLGGAPSINKQETVLDPEFNFPLGCCGSDGGPTEPSPGPCRGHLDKFDTEEASVTWTSGQDAYFQLTDYSYDPAAPGGTHSGGSCQVGFSVDKGKTWKMAASYHGACPHATTDGSPEAQTFDFVVPKGMPQGDALFIWSWLNREHESFVSCAKVSIKSDGNNAPPKPNKPTNPSTKPEYPTKPSSQPQYPEHKEPVPSPAVSSSIHAGGPVVTTTVVKTIYASEPTDGPSADETESEDSNDSEESEESSESEEPESEDSEDAEDSHEDDEDHYTHRPHRRVVEGARRYEVDGSRCECRRDALTLAVRCACDAPDSGRSDIERKARRLHRRTFYKRVDACNWDTAPAMETSYYTKDANCAPNAKLHMPESDTFELKWDVSCGVVEGTSEYPLKTMNCNMYNA